MTFGGWPILSVQIPSTRCPTLLPVFGEGWAIRHSIVDRFALACARSQDAQSQPGPQYRRRIPLDLAEKQVPHRAFGSVRNDIPKFAGNHRLKCSTRGASAPGSGEVVGHGQAEEKQQEEDGSGDDRFGEALAGVPGVHEKQRD
jgi:hypothetical protein